ncbi:ATP-dependent RNA helicase DDX23/PRP28 [Fistulifera solaris]|uniref:RNA helicase n=1 Tax=Fistulifera solaris TaxID=1519565 RepID=A0A1Z5J9H0_FISSO|nr:ATP-dependent RNA helicase DDX23/PRP28 [Fistulifera solaris]|eukprot:GAX10401.1 ATP-dependent RNA helicase DDX23/PRP28 [Fistulifera solaris]
MQLETLIDPALLEGLSEFERKEALAAAEAAKRAEERAEQRAIERALRQKELERQQFEKPWQKTHSNNKINGGRVVYVPKQKRKQQTAIKDEPTELVKKQPQSEPVESSLLSRTSTAGSDLTQKQHAVIKDTYLGVKDDSLNQEMEAKQKQQRGSKKRTMFKFQWDDTDDTFETDDPLYATPVFVKPQSFQSKKVKLLENEVANRESAMQKPLSQMTNRDWRILRENYEIHVRGGQAPPPLRSFEEASPGLPSIHPLLIKALFDVMRFKEPSPIQRQAIPVGLQRRDMIGIAETGSGKTVAFGVPLCHYLMQLPTAVLQRVAEEGPLALVLAPTRELAVQIDGEFRKLLSLTPNLITCPIVGGQAIQQQAQQVRKGVHIVVGTPGRINDCIEMAYLVLNQCCYVVLDEADRMVDMGFLPQVQSILDSMGGMLKSADDELRAYQQEQEDLQNQNAVARYRITAMFSATMPPEVEKIAKAYLRYPAVVSIGDQRSGKNSRIVQELVWLASPALKEKALMQQISNLRFLYEKVIVFVNEKKHAEYVGRIVERAGRQVVVLHGGKTQEQREESLATFRRGGVVMVATDVAGRGLDVPDVAHVINYDLPSRSIENYTHRIGRTGRAGKEGLATSLITEEDTGIMAALKAYLESTGNKVPERLARHPAANGTDHGDLIL